MPRILIVDDEPFQRMLIRETLADNVEFTFIEAENGMVALERVRSDHPDLILLDVMMPAMTGFQVCRIIKADPALRNIPVLLVTALDKIEDRVNGVDAGADDFINKPFEEQELQRRVQNALRRVVLGGAVQND